MSSPTLKPADPVFKPFQPPSGGDLTLRSSDGIEFRVHSLLLHIASTVFSDMFQVGTNNHQVVDLAEDSQTIGLMLEHIYPVKSPVIDTFDKLEMCLTVARKYDIKGMMGNLDAELRCGAKSELVAGDPLRACVLADSFDLSEAGKVLARLVDWKTQLLTPEALTRLKTLSPRSELSVRLVGTQAARANILSEILFGFTQYPMNPSTSPARSIPICQNCDKIRSSTVVFVPSWMVHWSHSVYKILVTHDFKDLPPGCNFLDPELLPRLAQQPKVNASMVCAKCVGAAKASEEYVIWVSRVRDVIDSRLRNLDHLYERP
ncbi:Broad-Complex, Tramtrack and Bric a brac, partial [Rhizoctonia solani]